MIRLTALLAIIVMALFGSAVALAEEPDANYNVEPGASVTFVTPPLSLADRHNCEGAEQTLDRSTNRCVYGAQSDFQRTVCRGPFTYSLPVDYGKLDPDVPDNSIVRPNGARWTVTIPGDSQIGEVVTVTILIEGVMDVYHDASDDGIELVTQGAECALTRTIDIQVGAPAADHVDAPLLAAAQAGRPVASSDDYVPPSLNRCMVVQLNRSSPINEHDKTNSRGSMSWCGDLGEYAPNGRRLADLCAEAKVSCRQY